MIMWATPGPPMRASPANHGWFLWSGEVAAKLGWLLVGPGLRLQNVGDLSDKDAKIVSVLKI